MRRVGPWHSIKADAPRVYHDNTACTEGNNIEAQYRRPGTDGRRRCEHCERLDAQGA